MDQQLGQQPDENQESANEPAEEQESESKQPRDEYTPGSPIRKSHTGLTVFLTVIITAIIAGGGVYLWLTYFQPEETTNANVNQTTATTTNANKNANISNINGKVVVNGNTNAVVNGNANTNANVVISNTNSSATAGWQTYTNTTIGYSLKYPSTWSLSEYNLSGAQNSPRGTALKQIWLKSPDGDYQLTVGVKSKTDDFDIWNRTGIGDGDMVDGDQVTIAGQVVTLQNLVYQDKIKEVFLPPANSSYIEIGNYQITGYFSYIKDSDYDSVNITSTQSDYLTAKNILASITLIELTSNQQTYANAKMKYTFDYSKSWTIKENDSEQNGYNVVDVDFYNQQNQKVAQLVCPLPETGFEMFDFVSQTRNLVKNSITYEIYLGLGTPLPESGRQNGLNMIWIRPLDAQGQTQVGQGTDSCGIFSGSDIEPDDKIFIAIYDSIE